MPPKIKNPRKIKKKILVRDSDEEENLQDILKNDYESLDLFDTISVKEYENKKELFERKSIQENDEFNYLYPSLDDPDFNIKISEKKEFFDNRYDGKITNEEGETLDVSEQADKLCNAEYELAPHQLFVRNFLSFQTPYNSLLLYHGLGSGKTCSAISVAEEMRDYLNQMGINQEIIVVASPNVQENFKIQLFDERKLEQIDGLWNLKACTGNKFLKEINPMNMKGLSREKVISQVNQIIRNNYVFKGYIEFANYIREFSNIEGEMDEKRRAKISKAKLNRHFNGRLIIIDEVHNIRFTDENKDKRVAIELIRLVENVDNLRLLLLSATPMYNSFKEIIWLINLMNMNDKRPTIEASEVFSANGNFKVDETGREIGRELLERKATGYISFVRGENPFMFPYRIWPALFSPGHSILHAKAIRGDDEEPELLIERETEKEKPLIKVRKPRAKKVKVIEQQNTDEIVEEQKVEEQKAELEGGGVFKYPVRQINGKPVSEEIELIDLYLTKIGSYQSKAYQYIIKGMMGDKGRVVVNKKGLTYELPDFENMERFGYTMLQTPIQALNIVFPDKRLDKINLDEDVSDSFASDLIGSTGLNRIMSYETIKTPYLKKNFKYKSTKYDRIFAPEHIGKYSSKIKEMCDNIMDSTGVILIYSEHIDGGIIPVALALEELGFSRYGSNGSLFETAPTSPIDAIEFKTRDEMKRENKPFRPAQYIMITGDPGFSPDNVKDLKALTDKNNVNGEIVKVVLISLAGAEGLDFKNVRQVHVMEPWYNMNRIEQIIGRAVRNCSHKDLPFKERNVLIFLYGTRLDNNKDEAADLYVYRLAQLKAIQIGAVTRVLKEIAVDCILNYEQLNFIENKMNVRVRLNLSNNKTIDYDVGDKPYTSTCDYMKSCEYVCRPSKALGDAKMDTFNEKFIFMNTDKIIQRIRNLFKEKHFYTKQQLITRINVLKEYPLVQINAALTQLIDDKTEYISDQYGRLGNLVNIGHLYLFQPIELTSNKISLYERMVPLQHKEDNLKFLLPEKLTEIIIQKPEEGMEEKPSESNELVNKLEADYLNATNIQEIKRGEENWYVYCGETIHKMESEGIERSLLIECLLHHMVEMLDYEDTIVLLNYLYSSKSLSPLMSKLKEYYDRHLLRARGIEALYLQNNNVKQMVILKDNKWTNAEAEDLIDLSEEILKLIVPSKRLAHVIGFISNFKKNYMIFKVKDMDIKRKNAGARCDQQGKNVAIKMLDKILGKEAFDEDEIKGLNKFEICIRQEFMLRMFDMQNKNNKRWLLTPIEAILLFEKEKVAL